MNNQEQDINWRLLVKVARGQAGAADKAAFDAWIRESPETNKAIFEEVKEIYREQEEDPGASAAAAAAFAAFMQRNDLEPELEEQAPLITRWPYFRVARMAAAAAVLVALAATAYLFRNNITAGNMALEQPGILKWKELHVANGKQVQLTLADGSVIRLGPGSSLRYPEAFAGKERRVQLEGEAFFSITRDTAHPFIVQTDKLETRVLGTSFNIEAFRGQPLAKVTVVTGKVAVSKNSQGSTTQLLAYLTPEEQIVFDNRDDSFRVKTISENAAHATRDGKLVFDSSSMSDVAQAVARRFGIEVKLADDHIAGMHLTSVIDGSSLDRVILMLHMSTGLKVQRQDNNLYLSAE